MTPVTFKCPLWLVLVLAGAGVFVGLLFPYLLVRFLHLTTALYPYFMAAGGALALFGVSLLPTQLEISDEGIRQRQIFSRFHVRWDNLVEWHFSKTQDINVFWVKDKAGKMHYIKNWLIFGKRANLVTKALRDRGIPGKEGIGR